ncbi:hypothetical protein D9758_006489 [Tetrapyrgos nigripes]|uniref:TPR-like protein n=1 Tax=Tetrapyrgos nigripes TaxID=182062 RepID=A0A8H5GLB8_9AGAR|nr:hypothetical protein D9758_006489 [Tetrapyrgos nigripes]
MQKIRSKFKFRTKSDKKAPEKDDKTIPEAALQETTSANLYPGLKEDPAPPTKNARNNLFEGAHDFVMDNVAITAVAGNVIHNHYHSGQATDTSIQKSQSATLDALELATPVTSKIFTGRDDLLNEAVQLLCSDKQAHLAVLGPGGIGKTSLALHIASNEKVAEIFKNNQYFIPCDLLPDAPALVQGMLQILNLSPPEGKDGYNILYQYLKLSESNILLTLDNFETPWNYKDARENVRNLIEKIADLPNVHMIVTMRGPDGPGNISWHKLGTDSGLPTLALDAAKAAFSAFANKKYGGDDSEKLEILLNYLDCMPLAIMLTAQHAKQLPLNTLIRMWTQKKTSMLNEFGTKAGKLTSVEFSIDVSLQVVASSDREALKLLPILSYLPNGIPLWPDTVSQIWPEFDHLELAISSLLQSSLIFSQHDTLRMLSPIREYIQKKYSAETIHLYQMETFYLSFIDNLPADEALSQSQLDPHFGNITKILKDQIEGSLQQSHFDAVAKVTKYTKFYSSSIQLLESILNQKSYLSLNVEMEMKLKKIEMLRWMGNYQEAINMIQDIQRNAEVKLNLNDNSLIFEAQQLMARSHQKLGDIYYYQNLYSESMKAYQQGQYHFKAFGDQQGVSECLLKMGEIHLIQHRLPEAMAMLEGAKIHFDRSGNQDYSAQCLRGIADVQSKERKWAEAEENLQKAKHQFEAHGHTLGVAQCLIRLGDMYRLQQKYPEAKELIEKAQNHCDLLEYQLGAGQCLLSLASIYRIQDQYALAINTVMQAKLQYERVGHQLGVAQCLKLCADLCLLQDKKDEAKRHILQAKTYFEAVGGQENGIAACFQSLADIYKVEGHPDEVPMLLKAKETFESIPEWVGVAQCLRSLADVHSGKGEYFIARKMLEEANDHFKGSNHTLGMAQCLQRLGDIHRKLSEHSDAMEKLQDAKTQFENIGHHMGIAQCQMSLGSIFEIQENFAEASRMLEGAKKEYQTMRNRLNTAVCCKSLGSIYLKDNQVEKALESFEEAKTSFLEINNQFYAADCLWILARINRFLGNISEANAYLLEAKKLYGMIKDHFGVAECLEDLANISRMQGHLSEAIEMLEEAKEKFLIVGSHIKAAFCLQTIGEIFQMQEKFDEAMDHLNEALNYFSSNSEHKLAIAQCLCFIGRIHGQRGQFNEAVGAFTKAHSIFQTINARPEEHGYCLYDCGLVLLDQRKYSDAREAFSEALEIFTLIPGFEQEKEACTSLLKEVDLIESEDLEQQLQVVTLEEKNEN